MRVVAVVPGGRRALLACLIPHLLRCDLLDRIEIVLNTVDADDLAYMRGLESGRVKVVDLPGGAEPRGNKTVNLIYPGMVAEDTLYLKIDDDVVWMGREAIERLLVGLLRHPQAFLATPLVINNGLGVHVLQRHRLVDAIARYVTPVDGQVHRDAEMAAWLHRWFLGQLASGQEPVVPEQIVASMRFSINMIAFRGADMARLGGDVPELCRFGNGADDEEYLTVHAPSELSKYNVLVGDSVAAHFAFRRQYEALCATDILARYQGFLPE